LFLQYDNRFFAPDSAYFCRDLIEAADTIQKMKTSSGSVIRSLAEMQTSALNLHQKTAGGYIRPFAATTGTVTGCCRDDPDHVLFNTFGQYCGDPK
jgi:hypothetical protein